MILAKIYRVILPLANPDTEEDLTTIGAVMALYNHGEVIALNILDLPRYSKDNLNQDEFQDLINEHKLALEKACRHAQKIGVKTTPVTLASQKIQDTIINEAKERNADLIVMGWSGPTRTPGAVMGRILDKVVSQSPTDIAILRSRGFKNRKILLPTAGGEESYLGGKIAAALQHTLDAEVTLLHLVRKKQEMDNGKEVLSEFSKKYQLKAKKIIKLRENFTQGILEESKFHDLVIIGGSQDSIFKKMFLRTIPEKVVEQAECSVLVTRCQGKLPFMTYLFGYRG